MRYRQIHLDFHTSEHIPGVGSRFDPTDFAQAYVDARVNAVNLFAKCHHGWSYHPTRVGRMHPNLTFDLLRAQVSSLQAVGIATPIYVSALWDERSAREHPEWRIVSPDNSRPVQHGNELEAGWKFLDLSSPYTDRVCAQVEEVVTLFPHLDGLWVDICFQLPSVSEFAKAGMQAQGLDWTDAAHRSRYAESVTERFYARIAAIARRAGVPVFFNSGHIRRGRAGMYREHFSHIEIESLPTGEWGYEHFPVSARYVEPLGMPYLGMTGKFHHMWGEVGGYKLPEALRYECGAMLAQGARCNVGDHLHPTGAIDRSTHAGLRLAFEHVEALEAWCEGSSNRAEIGVISAEAVDRPDFCGMPSHHRASDDGCVRLLLEGGYTFDLLDADGDFATYRLLILPDEIVVDDEMKERLDAYLGDGGRLLLTGCSGLRDGASLFDDGSVHEGISEHTAGDYALPVAELQCDFVSDPLFMYGPSQRLRIDTGDSLGHIHEPYFDRRDASFSGHLHTPCKPEPGGYAFGSRLGPIMRLAHPIFTLYHRAGAVAMQRIAANAIAMALAAPPMIRTSLPTAGRATLRRQPGRDVLHLLHATPVLRGTLRGDPIQPIQDIVELHDIRVDVEAPDAVAVRSLPSGEPIGFTLADGRARFTVPVLRGHAAIELVRER